MERHVQSDWVAVDWGTSHIRAWLVSKEGEIKQRRSSSKGMSTLSKQEFEPALIELIGDFLSADTPIQVIACGMVGSRQGWVEAKYCDVSGTPIAASEMVRVLVQDKRLNVSIIAGLKQSEPADVMRGEETQIAGFLADKPDYTGVICLPGTHTKWIEVNAGQLVRFQTVMTGELFSLLSNHSVLRFNLQVSGFEEAAFKSAVTEALEDPNVLAKSLFGLRAKGLLEDVSDETTKARLSGLLVGTELSCVKEYWQGKNVAIIGSEKLSPLYSTALASRGIDAIIANVDEMTVKGLYFAFQALQEKLECLEN